MRSSLGKTLASLIIAATAAMPAEAAGTELVIFVTPHMTTPTKSTNTQLRGFGTFSVKHRTARVSRPSSPRSVKLRK